MRMIVAWILCIYATIIVLLNMPFMQSFIADRVAGALSDKLGTRVSIGSVNVGFLNRLIINDLEAEDEDGVMMLKVGRVSASVDIMRTIQGQICIPSAQLFGATAVIYKKTKDAPLNIQYVIDAFSSKEDKESSPLNLRINTILVRHTNIKFDVKSERKKPATFDVNHIDARNIGFNVSLKALTDDSLNVSLKRFSTLEYNSGLYIRELGLKCEANTSRAEISDFVINTGGSSLSIPNIDIDYSRFNKDKSFTFLIPVVIDGQVLPADFSCFMPSLVDMTEPYYLHTELEGSSDRLEVNSLELNDEDRGLNLAMSASICNVMSNPSVDADIERLGASGRGIRQLLHELKVDEAKVAPLLNAGNVELRSVVHYDRCMVAAKGNVMTDAGNMRLDASYGKDKRLQCNLSTEEDGVNVGMIIGEEKLGSVNAGIVADITFVDNQEIPDGTVKVEVESFEYNDYKYSNINIDATSVANKSKVVLAVDDANASLSADIDYVHTNKNHNLDLTMALKDFNPHAMNLVKDYANERLSVNLDAHLNGSGIDNANGSIAMNDVRLVTPDTVYSVRDVNLNIEQRNDGYTNLVLLSDFLDARVKGHGRLSTLASDIKNIIATNLNEIVKKDPYKSDSEFNYDIAFYDSPILHHFIKNEYSVSQPVRLIGSMDASRDILNLDVNVPYATFDGSTYKNVNVVCCNNSSQLSVKASGLTHTDKQAMKIDLYATAVNNVVDSNVKLKMKNRNDIDVNLNSRVSFADSIGKLKTDLNIYHSDIVINDTTWDITPARISVYGKDITCHNLKVKSGDKYVTIEGKVSDNPSDSILARLNNVEIEYVLNIVNFTAVDFSGIATGQATLTNLLDKPNFKAKLNVKDFCLEGGLLGNAEINGNWDDEVNGIALNANIVNMYKCRDGLTSNYVNRFGTTKVKGFVSPADNDIFLHVDAMDTHAAVLQGFLGIIFDDMDGYLRGSLNIVGPLNKIDLEGDVTGQVSMKLKTTNVPYMFSGDTVHLERGLIAFNDMRMMDYQHNVGILNGKVTHTNLRNFAYNFDAEARGILVYDEKEFNANKFCATVFASGDVHLDGSDGHPMHISGNIYTNKGSVFAYDNVSPDALVNSSFIEFRDITATNKEEFHYTMPDAKQDKTRDDDDLSQYIVKSEKKKSNYEGDIYMDFHCNINQNCEVKLRMDRQDDAYISVYGDAILQAKWHNKGAFQMFGTYYVDHGKYRLYMHDLVYRDLSMQPGSTISFNGNPFDAGIHLICNHEIHNVPISDLTSTTAYSQNNKVKVVCVLDITGTVSAMDFKFDISLPNVNDETRQLVKSMINSDEEMNTQVIYLLAVNRFYPNNFARANGNDNSGQAVNSFVSSTLSGQINQALSSIIGTNSNWNLGTDISTGEKGWQDMDVEGILSGRLFNDRLLVNGNFGYRDNALTNTQSFIGDFELKWRLWENGNTYLKAYNMTNDRYFTKGTLNTQGLGVSVQYDFESLRWLFGKKKEEQNTTDEK
ncbi:MAG: translocation/assembly module TamB domain-containing protein [Bacteroidaceae bacterium]|nr:translocation/assembly module TamB domain-containing protein [Bacteroidaceae bacterium]